nr:MBL fold metallo-hydrolase [Klebsiella pneumoniae subsp. pneumoniae]
MCLAAGAPFPARKIPRAAGDRCGQQTVVNRLRPHRSRALWQRGGEVNDIDAIYFTHVHPDHCNRPDGATEPLEKLFPSEASHYLPPAGAAAGAHAAGRAGELAAGGPWFHHRLAGMPRSLDVAGPADPHCPTQHELSNRAIRITIAGQTLFYSGDGRPTADSIALMAGAGLAFQECASVAARTMTPRMAISPPPDAVQNAAAPGAGALSLRGCFPVGAKQACQPWPGLFVSRDGLTLTLPRPTPTDETYLL